MKAVSLFLFISFTLFTSQILFAQSSKIDNCDDLSSWQKVISDGSSMQLSLVDGYKGKCIKIDYSFTGAGYCGIQKNITLDLPNNYMFIYYLKAHSPDNNLEFKLSDSTGDNVYWLKQYDYEFPAQWEKEIVRKRDIKFAWGPAGGGEIKKAYSLQIIISAAQRGKGSVYIDELNLEEIVPPKNPNAKPIITATSTQEGSPNNLLNQKNIGWKSNSNEEQSLLLDCQFVKEYGGLVIKWDSVDYAKNFEVLTSNDKNNWDQVYSNKNGNGNYNFVYIKNGESRYIKIDMHTSSNHNGYGIKNIKIEDYTFADSYNNFFKDIAAFYPKGFFPKYFSDVQSYWTIIGVSEDYKEALINEEGAIEVDKGSFRVEPFIYSNNKLITWADAKISQNLEDNYLPIPSVNWDTKNFNLEIKTFAAGDTGNSSIYARYRIKNVSSSIQNGSFFLAVRPFQVNPPWQFLNVVGGASKINNMDYENGTVIVNKNKRVIPLNKDGKFGAAKFNSGEIITYLDKCKLPDSTSIEDNFGFASGALKYNFNLAPNSNKDFIFVIQFYKNSNQFNSTTTQNLSSEKIFDEKLAETKSFWQEKLNHIKFDLPHSADKYINTMRSNLAYILIDKEGPAFHPGARSYERCWIRDGSMIAGALLRLGLFKEVKGFLDWYSRYQYPSGKIPCVVDQKGAEPLPENDSHGEFIYAILQYFIFSHDTLFLKEKYDNIKKTVDYIEFLTDQRKTKQYQKKDSLAFYGLMPESISHEGYSAHPMHSYWDDFFTMRGLKDAVTIANILQKKDDEKRFIKFRDEFKEDLYRSIDLAMKMHNIDYIPGCVELGDFDATSTTVALYPGNELSNLPEPQLQNTFNKYYDFFNKRLQSGNDWVNYTPYEIRVAGTFLYLGQKEKTHKLLKFFFNDLRPYNWNEWAEVVWKDKDTPKFIGDMPHTWIGSDYLTVARAIFGYEREGDSSLVLGAGIIPEWLNRPKGISVNNFSTLYGQVSYHIQKNDNKILISISGNITIPVGGIIFKSPLNNTIKNVRLNNNDYYDFKKDEVKINNLPVKFILEY